MNQSFRLSKSRIPAGLQCRKRLWLETRRREIARVSPASEHIFRMGHLSDERARSLMGQGVPIGHVRDIERALEETRAALGRARAAPAGREPVVYEAAFSHRCVVARTDGFAPYRDGWQMTEVKAASAIDDSFYQDCAIQVWVAEGVGYPVRRVTLVCINSGFVYPGGGEYGGLLRRINVGAEVAYRKKTVGEIVEDFRSVAGQDEPPNPVGPHCFAPFACRFVTHCGAEQSPARREASNPQATPTRPRHFITLEAVASPVPLCAGTRPYQHVPVQSSCVSRTRSGTLNHRKFLDAFDATSKHEFVRTLLEALSRDGAESDRAWLESLCECVRNGASNCRRWCGACMWCPRRTRNAPMTVTRTTPASQTANPLSGVVESRIVLGRCHVQASACSRLAQPWPKPDARFACSIPHVKRDSAALIAPAAVVPLLRKRRVRA